MTVARGLGVTKTNAGLRLVGLSVGVASCWQAERNIPAISAKRSVRNRGDIYSSVTGVSLVGEISVTSVVGLGVNVAVFVGLGAGWVGVKVFVGVGVSVSSGVLVGTFGT